MPTFTKLKLSESSNGKNIKVAATLSPGTLIHTAHATSLDEIFLEAVNNSTSAVKLTIELGGTAAGDKIEKYIPPQEGMVLVIPGFTLTNSLEVRAFAGTADVIMINGYVHRIA